MSTILTLDAINVHYGRIQAIHDLSFEVNQGEILTLIGCNGAGKSSVLRAISGLIPVSRGRITIKGENVTGLPPHEIVRRRTIQVPEGRGIFLNLTVEENLDLGAWAAPRSANYAQDLEYVYELFPRIRERLTQNAGTLSGGEQQMLAISRALMGHPDLLLLDEPSLGLAPQLIEKIFEMIVRINREGKTVLLVEQNAHQALSIAHRGVVLETGRKVLQDTAANLLKSDDVRRAYLGG